MKKTFVILALASLVSACNNSNSNSANNDAAVQTQEVQIVPKVTVVTVGMRDVLQDGTFTSTVQANVVNNIAPQTANRIVKIKAEIGDFVYAGQVLAEMEAVNLEQTKLQLINDSTELARIQGLYEVGGVSKSDLDAITLAYNVRKTAYQNLKDNTILRSPITGVVTARNYDKGDMYSMAQPLFTVQQITPVKLLVGISESYYTVVKKGDKVKVTADALPGKEFEGSIIRLYPTIDPATHTFTAEVRVANSNRLLRPGMYAKVNVNFGKNHSVVIPDKAVVRQQGSGDKFVYVLNDDNTVSFRKIVLGVRMDNEYEILEGLDDGDKVVTEGQIRIKDGITVEATIEE